MTAGPMCTTCAGLQDSRIDALQVKTVEVVETFHNPCAPVIQYTCSCKTCGTRWLAIEVFDEDGHRPSEWSWDKSEE